MRGTDARSFQWFPMVPQEWGSEAHVYSSEVTCVDMPLRMCSMSPRPSLAVDPELVPEMKADMNPEDISM